MGRIAWVLAAGFGAFALVMLAFAVAIIATFMVSDPSGPELEGALLLAAAPGIMSIGGALPLRALGLTWRRGIGVALACHYAVGASWFALRQMHAEPIDIGAPTSVPLVGAVPIIIAAALTIAVGIWRLGGNPVRVVVTASVAGVGVLAAIALPVVADPYGPLGTIAILLAWLLLPAAAT